MRITETADVAIPELAGVQQRALLVGGAFAFVSAIGAIINLDQFLPSYHIDRLRQAPAGYFFDVMTNGFGAMPDYRAQVDPADRWAIVAYIRALQRSQQATLADVPPEAAAKLKGG